MLRRLVSRFIAFCLSPTATLSRALGAAAAVCTRLRKLLKSLAIDPVANWNLQTYARAPSRLPQALGEMYWVKWVRAPVNFSMSL